jgi:aminodeoxyfutalosine synthase
MAGSEEQNPAMSTSELVALINQAGRVAVERDTLYKEIKVYDNGQIQTEHGDLILN